MTKRVSTFKITLANGQTLADAKITEDGKLEGTTNHMTYMGPVANVTNGFVKLEIDSEIIEGATLEIGYEIKAINQSEVDYMSERYYKYGIQEGEIVTLTPAAVVDYLDKNLGFEQSDNTDWKQITLDELNNLSAVKISDTDYLNAKMILYTDKTAKALKPTETVSVNLNVSKILTSSEDLTFDNDAEVVKITPPDDGNTPPVVPPEYPPVTPSEQIQIVPSTGANMDYLTPTIIGVVSLVILGVGAFIIKKKVIDNK